MKKLTLIFLLLCSLCKAQALKSDFTKHYYAGCAISGFCASTVYYATQKPGVSALSGLFCGIIAGIVKEEIYDRSMKKGAPTFDDKAATGLGSCLGTIHFIICIHNLRIHKKEATKIDAIKYEF